MYSVRANSALITTSHILSMSYLDSVSGLSKSAKCAADNDRTALCVVLYLRMAYRCVFSKGKFCIDRCITYSFYMSYLDSFSGSSKSAECVAYENRTALSVVLHLPGWPISVRANSALITSLHTTSMHRLNYVFRTD